MATEPATPPHGMGDASTASSGTRLAATEAGLRQVIYDGMATQALVTLTGGAFLAGFAVLLGAPNILIGLIAAVAPLAQLLQIPGTLLVERWRRRRSIVIATVLLGRVPWLLVAVAAVFLPAWATLVLLIVVLAVNAGLGAVGGCAWNSWMRDLVPRERLGDFFSRRMTYAVAISIPLMLAGGYLLDQWVMWRPGQQVEAFAILFGVGGLIGLGGALFLARTPEPPMPPVTSHIPILPLLRQPFEDPNWRALMAFVASWSFAVNLAAPFFAVYMLTRLGLDIGTVVALAVLSLVANVVFLRFWGRFSDRYSNKAVLAVCGPLFMLSVLAWTFTTLPDTHAWTLPLLVVLHVVLGVATAGINLAGGNIGMKLAPEGQATVYLAAGSIVNAIAAGVAPILGGLTADLLVGYELALDLRWTTPTSGVTIPTFSLQQWDFFFVLAFLVGLYALHRLSIVREEGEIDEREAVQRFFNEVRREVQGVSTVAGVRQLALFPVSTVWVGKRRLRRRNPPRE